jgi:hypothetical protein
VLASVEALSADRAEPQAVVSITKQVKVIRQVFMSLSFHRFGPPFADRRKVQQNGDP